MKITTYMILHSNHTFYWQQCRYVMVLSFEILWYTLCALRKLLKNCTGFWDNTLTLSETCDTCKHQKTWPSFFHIMMCCPSSTKLISKLMLVHCQSGYLAHIWMNLESTLKNFNDSLKIAVARAPAIWSRSWRVNLWTIPGHTYHEFYPNNLLRFSHTPSTLKFTLKQILVTARWPPKH